MNKRRQQISEGEKDYFEPIPVELIINILSRLPLTKSKAQCRCVSKLWSSIIRRPHNNLLFPVKPPATPRLLLVFHARGKLFFKSSPQTRNPDKNSSSLVAPLHHRTVAFDQVLFTFCRPVGGLIFRHHIDEKNYTVGVISNPITGESLTLPKRKVLNIKGRARYSFGYDPIDKQFKVLSFTWLNKGSENLYCKYHVLTLGSGDRNHLSWRQIQCCTLHYLICDTGICIDGVLFYPARMISNERQYRMVCFNVRSEEFSFIDVDQDLANEFYGPVLINYKGKLGACVCDIIEHNLFEFKLWVLEDAEKHKWSKHVHIYQIPRAFMYAIRSVHIAGMNGSGEIVLCPMYTQDPFFVFFYNLESNIITRVRFKIPVFGELEQIRVHAFPDYVVDVKLM